jgi:hypothetical protein
MPWFLTVIVTLPEDPPLEPPDVPPEDPPEEPPLPFVVEGPFVAVAVAPVLTEAVACIGESIGRS